MKVKQHISQGRPILIWISLRGDMHSRFIWKITHPSLFYFFTKITKGPNSFTTCDVQFIPATYFHKKTCRWILALQTKPQLTIHRKRYSYIEFLDLNIVYTGVIISHGNETYCSKHIYHKLISILLTIYKKKSFYQMKETCWFNKHTL